MAKISVILSVATIVELSAQLETMKRKHPDAVMLFRHKDDYIILASDAQATMRDLDIKPNVIDLPDVSGFKYLTFPHKELEFALPRLIRRGHRVAICENLEDPRKSNKIVKRNCDEQPKDSMLTA